MTSCVCRCVSVCMCVTLPFARYPVAASIRYFHKGLWRHYYESREASRRLRAPSCSGTAGWPKINLKMANDSI